VPQVRNLGDPVERHVDDVPLAASHDLHVTGRAIDHEGRCPDALESVAQLAAGRADVVRLVRNADGIVERPLQHVRRQAGAVVHDGDGVGFNDQADRRRRAGVLARVHAIVDQLPHQGQRPQVRGVPDLHGEFLLGEELQQPAGCELGAFKGWLWLAGLPVGACNAVFRLRFHASAPRRSWSMNHHSLPLALVSSSTRRRTPSSRGWTTPRLDA
jgi:hypothetical protein